VIIICGIAGIKRFENGELEASVVWKIIDYRVIEVRTVTTYLSIWKIIVILFTLGFRSFDLSEKARQPMESECV